MGGAAVALVAVPGVLSRACGRSTRGSPVRGLPRRRRPLGGPLLARVRVALAWRGSSPGSGLSRGRSRTLARLLLAAATARGERALLALQSQGEGGLTNWIPCPRGASTQCGLKQRSQCPHYFASNAQVLDGATCQRSIAEIECIARVEDTQVYQRIEISLARWCGCYGLISVTM